jgi:hypothetical protein
MNIRKIELIILGGSFEDGYQGILRYPNDRTHKTFELPSNRDLAEKYKLWCSAYEEMITHRYRKLTFKSTKSKPVQEYIDSCKYESEELIALFDNWLESQEFRPAQNEMRSHFQPNEENLLVIKTKDTNLWQLPWCKWQLIKRDYSKTEVIFSLPDFTPSSSDRKKSNSNNINVLSILGDSTGLNFDKEEQILKTIIPNSKFLREPSQENLDIKLRNKWDILCFSGHSFTDNNECFIKINQNNPVNIKDLSEALKKSEAKIAIFNSCDNLGIAFSLERVRVLIPYLLLMSKEVNDYTAQEFFKYFLINYHSGKSFYLSVQEARGELQRQESEHPCASWLPIIVQYDTSMTAPTWNDLVNKSLFQKLKERWLPITSITSIMAVLMGALLYTKPTNLKTFSWHKINELGHLEWDKGESSASNFRIEPDNVLTIMAGSGTDHNRSNTHLKKTPRMTVPMSCDRNFEASVKVKFRSTISAQRAIFGISDPGRKSKYIYIYSLEGMPNPRVEAGMNSDKHSNPIDYQSDLLYLKIKNISGTIDLLYSEDNLEWKRTEGNGMKFPMKISFPGRCELYFEVLSTDLNDGISGKFIDFSVLYL